MGYYISDEGLEALKAQLQGQDRALLLLKIYCHEVVELMGWSRGRIFDNVADRLAGAGVDWNRNPRWVQATVNQIVNNMCNSLSIEIAQEVLDEQVAGIIDQHVAPMIQAIQKARPFLVEPDTNDSDRPSTTA